MYCLIAKIVTKKKKEKPTDRRRNQCLSLKMFCRTQNRTIVVIEQNK